MDSAADLAERLDATGYLADEGLATAGFLALRMHRPLFSRATPASARPRWPRRWPRCWTRR